MGDIAAYSAGLGATQAGLLMVSMVIDLSGTAERPEDLQKRQVQAG